MAANSGPQIEPSKQPCSLPNNSCSWTSFRAIPQKNTAVQWLVSFPTPNKWTKTIIFISISSLVSTSSCRICQCPTPRWLTWSHLLCPPAKPKTLPFGQIRCNIQLELFKQKVSETLKIQSTSPFLILLNETNASPPLFFSIGKSVRSIYIGNEVLKYSSTRFPLAEIVILWRNDSTSEHPIDFCCFQRLSWWKRINIVERRWNFECWNLCSDLNLAIKRQTNPRNPTDRRVKAEWLEI